MKPHAQAAKSRKQRFERKARIEMPLAREIKPGAEPPGKVRLQSGDFTLIHPLVPCGSGCETRKLGFVAGGRDDQRAVSDDKAGGRLVPPVERRLAERQHRLVRTFTFAPGRQHSARIKGCAARGFSIALRNLNGHAVSRQFEGRRQTGDPRSLDKDTHATGRLPGSRAACKARHLP